MKTVYVSLTRAKIELEELIRKAQQGDLIFICRYGKPKAWIEPAGPEYKHTRRQLRRAVRNYQERLKQQKVPVPFTPTFSPPAANSPRFFDLR